MLPTVVARLWARLKRLPWYRLAAGVVAGIPGLALTFAMRLGGLGVFLPEIAVDFTVGRIPGNVESFFIRTMGEGAKVLALFTAITVFLLLPGFYALAYRWVEKRVRNRWLVFALYGLVPAAVAVLVILPLLGAGFLGVLTPAGPFGAVFSQVLNSFLFAAFLDYFLVDVASKHPEGFSLSRRQFLAAVGILVAASVATLYGVGSFVSRPARLVFASVQEMIAKRVTPNEEFYVVTKNLLDPTPDARRSASDPGPWRLTVDGLVSNLRVYTYPELLGRTTVEEFVTLECVSNEVGGNLVSTARWTGIPLAALLTEAGVGSAADWVAFTCEDGYTVGVPLSKAMNASSLVALQMNFAELPPKHGFPARIIVPGMYGMFHAKWLSRITLVQGEFLGFWQKKGWTNRGPIRTTAIIATPPHNSVVGTSVEIGGVALAGDRGITRVEVSTDGGTTWAPATLLSRLSGLTWVLWSFPWTPSGGGSHRIVARAVDGTGAAQDPTPAPPFSEGASGYDSITLLVSG